jgi:hypothetical protein
MDSSGAEHLGALPEAFYTLCTFRQIGFQLLRTTGNGVLNEQWKSHRFNFSYIGDQGGGIFSPKDQSIYDGWIKRDICNLTPIEGITYKHPPGKQPIAQPGRVKSRDVSPTAGTDNHKEEKKEYSGKQIRPG